jgi:hypothetical protein
MACVGNLADIFSVLFPLISEQQEWVPSYAYCLWSWDDLEVYSFEQR